MKKREKEHTISKIRSDKGELIILPKEINKRFAQFYQNLYTSKASIDNVKITNFLEKYNLPKLNVMEQEELGAQITINESIKSLKNGKTLGPDGFSGLQICRKYYILRK